MDYYSSQISKLIQELSSLPGIGAKSAQRLAFHILNMPVEQVEELSSAIVDARKNVRYCKECFTLTDDELCPICKDAGRNHKTIMVVEDTRDLAAYEKTGILLRQQYRKKNLFTTKDFALYTNLCRWRNCSI